MEELIRRGDLALRRMRDDAADYKLMSKWLTDPRVLEFYEGRDNPSSLDRVIQEYSPRALLLESVSPCFLLSDDRPIGYMQFCPVVSEDDRVAYGLDPSEDAFNVYGIDQFIGEPGYWNRGTGTRAVRLLLSYLFTAEDARSVVVDPHVDNMRAIRCYEKCGFQRIKILRQHELHEGVWRDSYLMRAAQ